MGVGSKYLRTNEPALYAGKPSGFVIFCHLINVQFHFQHRRIFTHATVTGQRKKKRAHRIPTSITKHLLSNNIKRGEKVKLGSILILNRSMIHGCSQTIYDSTNYIHHWNRAKFTTVVGFLPS